MRSLDDTIAIQTRARALLMLIVGALAACAVAYWFVQILRGPHYAELAENNQYNEGGITAPRGKVLDRSGRVILVDNRPSFNLYVVPERCEDFDRELERLSEQIELGPRELERIARRRSRLRSFEPLLIQEDIPFEQMAYFEARADRYPWVMVAADHERAYPNGRLAAHLLGRVGEVSERQLQVGAFSGARPGTMVGQSGLERRYNEVLTGEDGLFVQVVDSAGRVVREVSRETPTPGGDLLLTIDFELQRRAEELLDGRAGALVALDVRSGEVLAMASAPSFDPNSYVELLPQLAADESSPLLNRAISSKFSPGSVWKVLIAAAALQEGITTPERQEFCGGAVELDNRLFHCHAGAGHGWMSLVPAITHSCNIYFYKTGRRLGIERIARWASRFGFGERTEIDLPYEVAGLVPTPEWSERVRNSPWYPSETVSISIGQGPLEVTPLQMAVFMAAVANGGRLVQPHLVRGMRRPGGELFIFPQPPTRSVGIGDDVLRWVREGLYGAVNRGGTAARARIPQISIAGKTGTAQVVRKRFGVSPEELPEEQRHHAWFVCFAPSEEPEVAVCVFVEHGGSASLSAVPLATEFLRSYAQVRAEQ